MLKIKNLLNLVFIGLFSANVIADVNPTGATLTTTLGGTSSYINNGTIDITSATSDVPGIQTDSNSGNVITNNGLISTTTDFVNSNFTSGMAGIISFGESAIITNSGSILINNGFFSYGIRSIGDYSLIINSNSIVNNSASGGYGIVSTGDFTTIINNATGFIQVNSGTAIINDSGTNATIINLGTISANGNVVGGIYTSRDSSTVSNDGIINVVGNYARGINSNNGATNNTISNSGSIFSSGPNSRGIDNGGDNNLIINSGQIISQGIDSAAIAVYGNNTTLQLLRGSRIVGNIVTGDLYNLGNQLWGTNNKLVINLGAGASYAYSVTGPWTITDLDNRPMVTGSAYAAGIGAQETSSEMLYQRTSAINSALDRRLRSYASDEVDNQPYWLDVYYSDVTRNSGGNYSTQTAFSNYNYGITAGFKLPTQLTPLELVVNVEQSNLNIDSGNQKIDSSSIMAGLLAPNIIDILGAKLSAKALLGYADHDGDRKVMTNSLLFNGSRQIKSDYNSTYAVLGTSLTKLYPITDRLTADVILGIDLNTQRFESYKESDYFAWDSRTLTQLHSRVQTGLDYKLWGDKGSLFARVGAEHRDLIGGASQDYSINGTNVSFNTNNKNDTYLTAQVGMRAQLEKRVHLFGVVNTLHSSDSVNSVSGNIGLRADF